MFIKTRYSVIIGEFAADDRNNIEARLTLGKYYIISDRKNHIVRFRVIMGNGIKLRFVWYLW